MRAVCLSKYGPVSGLAVKEVPRPVPKPGEILIRIAAVEVTKSDCELRSLRFPVRWFVLPLRLVLGWSKPRNPTLGAYFSGTVEEVGHGVTSFGPGDEVYGSSGMRFGAYAEFLALPERTSIAKKPANLSFVEAAALPLGGLNALHFMNRAALQPGDRMLILGAGGSIGSHAVQIAKARGAWVCAVDAAHKLSWLKELGADEVVDYQTTDVLAGADAYDVVFTTIAQVDFGRCLRALKPTGRYLTANPRFFDFFRGPWTNWTSDRRVTVAFAPEAAEELDALRQLVESHAIRPTVDTVYRLDEVAAAHERVETEQRKGCVILVPTPTA